MRITLDTNVLIAAFISTGRCNDLFEHCARHHDLFTSQFILDELRAKLLKKFKFHLSHVEGALNLAVSRMRVVEPILPSRQVCRDPDDDAVLGTAVAGRCDYLITGDRAVLEIGAYEGIKIISPRDFWDLEPGSPG